MAAPLEVRPGGLPAPTAVPALGQALCLVVGRALLVVLRVRRLHFDDTGWGRVQQCASYGPGRAN